MAERPTTRKGWRRWLAEQQAKGRLSVNNEDLEILVEAVIALADPETGVAIATEEEIQNEFDRIKHERESFGSGWWWLSFADGTRPEGTQFLGVAIVEGWTIQEAITRSHLIGVNPGDCEVSFAQIPDDYVPPEEFRNVLMDYAELAASGLLDD